MTNSTHTRIAAAGLVLGPLLFTLGDLFRLLVEPSGNPSASAVTAAVADNGGTWLMAGLLAVTGAYLFLPGIVGLIAAARGRGAGMTRVGAVLVGLGMVASVGHAVAFYSPYALYVKANTPGPDLEALDRVSESYPLLIVLILLFIIGMVLGPIVLLAGLWRARRVPIWSLVAVIVFVVSANVSSLGATALGLVAAMVAFVPAARSLLAPAAEPRLVPATQVGIAQT